MPHSQSFPAFAKHGHGAIGGMLPMRDLTQISTGSPDSIHSWDRGWICTAEGHLADGSVYTCHGKTYRLTVVAAAHAEAA